MRFTKDWGRVRCVDPDADVTMLEAMEAEMQRRLREDSAPLLKTIEDSFSHQLQMTQPKASLAENMAAELDQLMRLYVEPRKEKARQALSGRQAIVRQMRTQFEHARVWELMRKRIAAAEYTRPGDPLRIDAGYRPNGMSHPTNEDLSAGTPIIRMFHAVSLEPGVEMAKVLAFSAAGLRAGVERVEKASLELTAVIEPAARLGATEEEPERLEVYRFGVETMEEHEIRVLTTTDLGRVAETARRELRI